MKISKLVLFLAGMFLIGLIGAAVYQTPGTATECDCTWTEPPECICPDCSGGEVYEGLSPFGIIFIVVIVAVAIFIMTKNKIKKRKNKERFQKKPSGLAPTLVNNALENMEKVDKVPIASKEEFSELVDGLGLGDVINEKGEIKDNGQES